MSTGVRGEVGEHVARALAEASAEGRPVRPLGAGTKADWAIAGDDASPLSVELKEVREHNAGDLTAVVEAGVRVADLQALVGHEGQMLALDPPLGAEGAATVGGVVAAGDSGPLRHRYGSARDLVVGIRVALCDGTVAHAGGKVIKNVAGYDLAKLFCGSFGSLGAILELSVRLHPLPPATATAVGRSGDARALGAAALELSHAPLELQSLDVRWEDGDGAVLARLAGASPAAAAGEAATHLAGHGLATEVMDEDEELWDAQRDAQRGEGRAVARVSGLQAQLPDLLRCAADLGARVVGRAGLGVSYVTLPEEDVAKALERLRSALAPSPCVVLDAPAGLDLDPWGAREPAALALMRRVKERFDPAGVCSPGALGL